MKRSPYFLWQTDSAPAKLGFAESDCVLVLEGSAKAYTVTEPDDAAARTAAGQFAEHIYKMTGCRLPDSPFEGGIPVYIGRAAGLDLPDTEGFALAVGKDQRGAHSEGDGAGDADAHIERIEHRHEQHKKDHGAEAGDPLDHAGGQ